MSRRRQRGADATGDLFDAAPRLAQRLRSMHDWPDGERFPLNQVGGPSVRARLLGDLTPAVDPPPVVSGYASLAEDN